jgi:hypothetical protein
MAIHYANERTAEAAKDEMVSVLSGIGCQLYIQHTPASVTQAEGGGMCHYLPLR